MPVLAPFILLAGLVAPDAAPALGAVRTCDRGAIQALTRAEPKRRSTFAAAAYAEQQVIAAERARLFALPGDAASASGQATVTFALGQLDARQRQLDDARAVERSWRELLDEVRADFLANCTSGRRHADD